MIGNDDVGRFPLFAGIEVETFFIKRTFFISALIVFPALSAIRLFKSYKLVIIFASILGVINSLIGILVAILWGTPVGATVVIVDIFVYFVCWLVDIIIRNFKRV